MPADKLLLKPARGSLVAGIGLWLKQDGVVRSLIIRSFIDCVGYGASEEFRTKFRITVTTVRRFDSSDLLEKPSQHRPASTHFAVPFLRLRWQCLHP